MAEPMITTLEPIEASRVPAIYQPPPLPQIEPLTVEEIKRSIAPPDASDPEIVAFIKIAEHLGLDPWQRQIYFTKYAGRFSPVVGYQVYLQRAERTMVLDGWNCVVDNDEKPTKATLTIHRKDWKEPFVWETLRAEVAYTYSKRAGITERALHKSQPAFQLKKCCISQGFRMCFPTELGGMPYIKEELPLDEGYDHEDAKPPAPLENWKAAYFASIKDIPEFAEDADRRQFQLTHTGKSSVADMDKEDMSKLFAALDELFPEGSDGKRHALPEGKEPEPQPQAEPAPEGDSDSPAEEATVTLFNTVSQKFAEVNGLDPKYLYLYLASRFIVPALDEQAEDFLNRMKNKPGNIKSLKEAVLSFKNWVDIAGSDELMGCVTDLHFYSSNLDEDTGASFLQNFFTAYGIKPDQGLYKIWDIPAAAFGTWKFVVSSLAKRFGFADEDEIDESEISDDEEIPEDVPEADDDVPFF